MRRTRLARAMDENIWKAKRAFICKCASSTYEPASEADNVDSNDSVNVRTMLKARHLHR